MADPRLVAAVAEAIRDARGSTTIHPMDVSVAEAVVERLGVEQAGWCYPALGGGYGVLDINDKKSGLDLPVYRVRILESDPAEEGT